MCGGLDVVLAGLGGEHALGLVAVALAFAVFFVGVLDRDFLVHEVLAVHVGDGFVGGFEVGKGYEAVPFGEVGIIAGDLGLRLVRCVVWEREGRGRGRYLWRRYQAPESAECVVKCLLIHHGVEIADE